MQSRYKDDGSLLKYKILKGEKMNNFYHQELGYYPQIEISGEDVVKFAKRETILGIKDTDLTRICKLLNENTLLDRQKIGTRKAFLAKLNETLEKYHVGAKDLMFAFPDSEGNLTIDGRKYKNVGKCNYGFSFEKTQALGVTVFCLLQKRLRQTRQFLNSLKETVSTPEEYDHLVSKETKIDPGWILSNFFTERSSVISNACERLCFTNGVETIERRACRGCYHLTQVIFPDTLKTIKKEAFKDCDKLISIKIPNSVKILEESAFENCLNLNDVTIGKGVTRIGNYAFNNCDLQSITIPGNVKKIGYMAFSHNLGLKDVKIGDGVQVIENGTFANEIIKNIEVPDSIKTLEEKPFDKNYPFRSGDATTTYVLKTKEAEKSKDVKDSEVLCLPKEKVQEL